MQEDMEQMYLQAVLQNNSALTPACQAVWRLGEHLQSEERVIVQSEILACIFLLRPRLNEVLRYCGDSKKINGWKTKV